MSMPDSNRLGNPQLDDDHDRLFEALAALARCADINLGACLLDFVVVARRHFDREDTLMKGGDFPTRDCHLQEHAAVLASVAEVQALTAQGDVSTARRLVVELQRWLPEHIFALDRALAQWLFMRQTGGSRVTLHRPSRSGEAASV